MNLNRLHTTLRKEFRDLPAPEDFSALAGAHRGVYVGHAPVRASGPMFMSALRFRHWRGKRFAEADSSSTVLDGVNRFADGEPGRDRYEMIASIGPSLIDGRPAYVIEYPPDSPRPWNRARDEFRVIDEHRLLGITTFDFPLIRMLPLAYVLERDPGSPPAETRHQAMSAATST
jgi:hypothetical protein